MNHVGPRAVANEEAAREVDGAVEEVGRQRQWDRGGLVEVAECGDAIVVGCRETMLGGEAVVDGHDDGPELTTETAAEGVVGAGRRGEEHAVEVDKDGERGGVIVSVSDHRRRGAEHARPKAAGGVNGDVSGSDE